MEKMEKIGIFVGKMAQNMGIFMEKMAQKLGIVMEKKMKNGNFGGKTPKNWDFCGKN